MHMIQSKGSTLGVLAATLLLGFACSSTTTNPGGAAPSGSGGASNIGSGAVGTGGNTAGGGSSSGSGAGLTLQQACAATCSSQGAIACPTADCPTACVKHASDTPGFPTVCNAEYTAMEQCEASLTGDKWICSSDENVPIPVDGQCTKTVC